FERNGFLGQTELQRALSMVADRGTRKGTHRHYPAPVSETKRHGQQQRRRQCPPRWESVDTTRRRTKRRVSPRRQQSCRKLGARTELVSSMKRTPHALTECPAAVEIGPACRTRVQMTQNLVVRLSEELLCQKRTRHLTNVTTLHG